MSFNIYDLLGGNSSGNDSSDHGNVVEISSKAQHDKLIASDGVVVVDFSAVWCPPCQMIKPFFIQLSKKYTNSQFLKVDVDKHRNISFPGRGVPTFVFYQNGKLVESFAGADPGRLEKTVLKYGGKAADAKSDSSNKKVAVADDNASDDDSSDDENDVEIAKLMSKGHTYEAASSALSKANGDVAAAEKALADQKKST